MSEPTWKVISEFLRVLVPNYYYREGVYDMHWRSSNYAVTHVRIKDSKIQGRSSNVVKLIVHTIGNR